MVGDSYDGGLGQANKWGCIGASVVGLPVFVFLLLADALGDCAPDAPCRKGFLLMVLLPSLIAAVGAGLLVRFIVSKR